MRVTLGALSSSFCAAVYAGHALAQVAPAASSTPPAPTAAPAPPPAPPPAPASTLSAGGLAPPPAIEAAPAPGTPNPASTEAELKRADVEDSGRGLQFVWLNAEVGVTHIGLGTFHHGKLLAPQDVKANETGLVADAGAGVRLVFVTVGARFRYAPMPDYKLWSLGLEGGIHAPFGAFEPYGTLDLGYVSLGSFPGASSFASVHGFDARLGAGFDYFLTPIFSAGIHLSGDLMLLHRSNTLCSPDLILGGSYYCSSGSSTGGALSATAVAGLHF